MALGTDGIILTGAAGGAVAATDKGFIPEVWEDDVIAQYKANLVTSNLVSKLNHNGRKGDTIYLPTITDRKTAVPTEKSADSQVTLNAANAAEITVNINKHYEYSFLYEDIVSLQGLDSLRRHYTDHAGFALARQVDRDIAEAFEDTNGGTNYIGTAGDGMVTGSDGATSFLGTAGANLGNAAALTDAGIRNIIQKLDDEDNPMSDRNLVIPPVERNNIMGLARFTEQAFVGEAAGSNTIRNGMIGQLYGVGVSISTNLLYIHQDSSDGNTAFLWTSTAMGTGNVTSRVGGGTTVAVATDGGVQGRVALMFHRGAVVHAEQQGIRTQTQYKQEYLGDLFTADCVYGVAEQRDYAAVPIAVAA